MDLLHRSTPAAAPPAPSRSHRSLRNRLGALVPRGRRAAAAVMLVVSALVAGPAASADAEASATAEYTLVLSPAASELSDAERALGSRLALGYAGAVPAADVEALVRVVGRYLRENASPEDQLLQTTEAVSRRLLTDFLTRGTPLPGG